MHPTSAASRANSTASRGTQRLPRLPAYPSHSLSLVRFLVCLPPVVTYQPIPSHLSCARAALRSQSSSQSYPFPPSLFPRPFFRPYPAEPGHSAQKEASQPVRRPLPPPPPNPTSTSRYSTGRSGSTTPRPCSSSQLPRSPSTRLWLDWTAPISSTNAHPHALSAVPTVPQPVHLFPNPFAYRGYHQAGLREATIYSGPGGRTSAPTRPSLASIQA